MARSDMNNGRRKKRMLSAEGRSWIRARSECDERWTSKGARQGDEKARRDAAEARCDELHCVRRCCIHSNEAPWRSWMSHAPPAD